MPITPRLSRQLQQALGAEAAEDLVTWMHDMDARQAASGDTVRADIAELRTETHADFARLRQEMGQGLTEVRQEMTQGLAQVRQEIDQGLTQVRQEMDQGLTQVRQEMRAGFAAYDAKLAAFHEEMQVGFARLEARFERRFGDLLKWSFVFWVGAVAAVAMLAKVLP